MTTIADFESRDEDEDEEDEDGSIHVTDSGSTAVTCLVLIYMFKCLRANIEFCSQILDRVIYCANAGDSRAVLCRNGTAVDLSEDHKPTNAVERTRIENANGFVEDKRCVRDAEFFVWFTLLPGSTAPWL